MKKQRVLFILILSIVVLTLTIITSFFVESRSQKLPAVIFSEKVIISSRVEGVIKSYSVSSMQEVKQNDPIAIVANSRLLVKLETLRKERDKYVELINSAKTGDYLKTEVYDLEHDIQKNRKDMEAAKVELDNIREKYVYLNERFALGSKKYIAARKMYDNALLSQSDFEKEVKSYRDVQNEQSELKADSLVAIETIKSSQNIINLLQARSSIISSNVNILAAEYVIDLNDVDAKIKDLEEDIKSLQVYSPIAGIVTDINYLPGENVNKGDVIAEIADLSKVWVIAYGSSFSRLKVKVGQKVKINCGDGEKIWGKVVTISPVMEKVKSLSSSFETNNTYTKIEIQFDSLEEAMRYVTPGERLFVRIYF
ncbi:MAG: hypothetical protein CVU50_10415 [Candidatus Cloacimonetes bacterium HGW-Cloacimonetes-3]|nr:MAG: hypothetical protein CVU50_10415 [Candidatus Cloacimonetes bacterium HGW-Cloacimonetes-3]